MPIIRSNQRSLAGGEIAAELYGRLDLDKYVTGLALSRNFIILPHGPAMSRGGSFYINEAKDGAHPVRVISFNYNNMQTYAVEIGHNYIRFHTGGATLLEAAKVLTAITQASPGIFAAVAHGFVVGDWVFVTGVVGMTQVNGRFYKVNTVPDPNSFSLAGLDGAVINTGAMSAYISGGTVSRVYTLATTYDSADIFDIKYTQSADVMTLTHPSYATQELRRLGAANWTLTAATFAPTMATPGTATVVATTGAGTTKYEYVVTAQNASGTEESYPTSPAQVSSVNVTGITKANPGVIATGAAHGLVVGDRCYIAGVLGMVQLTAGVYKVNTVPDTTHLSLTRISDGTVVDTTLYSTYTGGGTVAKIEITNTLSTAGNKNTITWPIVVGASRYNVYKYKNGLYGYIGQTTENNFVDDNISADVNRCPPDPTTANPFPAANDFPAAVGYWDQRRVFCGTNNRPQNGWLTRAGTESNLTSSIPTQDDDAISFAIKSGQQDRILHVVALSDLIFLTAGTEWRLQTVNSDSLTPGSFSVKPQSYIGCNNVRPVVTANSALFVQARGSHLRELAYAWERNSYDAQDLSIMAPHLFLGRTIKDMAYTIAPYQIAWQIRDDGRLLGVTYQPEHKVIAWHQHDTTNGLYKSVCSIPENNEDAVYTVVERVINGRTIKAIERSASRQLATVADAFCVDCGLLYNGAPTSVVTNLWHLEGQMVAILADGAVMAQRQVVNGSVTLDQPASKIAIGLPMTCDLQTLPLAVEQILAYGRGSLKNINKAFIRVYNSSGIMAGPSFEKLTPFKQRTTEPYGSPPALRTGEIELLLSPHWSREGPLCIRQADPLPLTLVSLALEFDLAA